MLPLRSHCLKLLSRSFSFFLVQGGLSSVPFKLFSFSFPFFSSTLKIIKSWRSPRIRVYTPHKFKKCNKKGRNFSWREKQTARCVSIDTFTAGTTLHGKENPRCGVAEEPEALGEMPMRERTQKTRGQVESNTCKEGRQRGWLLGRVAEKGDWDRTILDPVHQMHMSVYLWIIKQKI